MSANREMNAAMKGSLSCEDSGMEEYIMKLVQLCLLMVQISLSCEDSGMEEYIMKFVPLGDRVVIKALVAEETTKSGIVLPGQAKEKPQQAEVIAVGPGGVVDGKEVVMQVKPGDKVIYSKYSGTEVKLDEDENLIIVKQSDILAIIE